MIESGIAVAAVWAVTSSLTKAAGMADRRSGEILRLTAGREAGGACGN